MAFIHLKLLYKTAHQEQLECYTKEMTQVIKHDNRNHYFDAKPTSNSDLKQRRLKKFDLFGLGPKVLNACCR